MKCSDRASNANCAVSRESRLYFEDMRDACERIARHRAGGDRLDVLSDPNTRDAILWNMLILREAAKQVPGEITERHPAIEWRRLAGFRDVSAHGYFGLDDDIL